jgi:hypothetical protein
MFRRLAFFHKKMFYIFGPSGYCREILPACTDARMIGIFIKIFESLLILYIPTIKSKKIDNKIKKFNVLYDEIE